MRLLIALATALIFASTPASADKPEIYVKTGGLFSSGWEHALGGYDTVAYHKVGKAIKGKEEFKTDYKGATWLFASQDNLDTFLADPDKYRPAYGGYCAYGLGKAKQLVHGDPEHWAIIDGVLYVNISGGIQKKWEKKSGYYIMEADSLWPEALGK